MATSDSGIRNWRNHLSVKSREKIVKRIMENLWSNIPNREQANVQDILNIALQFEHKTYDNATDQQDYLRRIVEKMRMLEEMAESSKSNHASASAAGGSHITGNAIRMHNGHDGSPLKMTHSNGLAPSPKKVTQSNGSVASQNGNAKHPSQDSVRSYVNGNAKHPSQDSVRSYVNGNAKHPSQDSVRSYVNGNGHRLSEPPVVDTVEKARGQGHGKAELLSPDVSLANGSATKRALDCAKTSLVDQSTKPIPDT